MIRKVFWQGKTNRCTKNDAPILFCYNVSEIITYQPQP